ncbi:hypothetical protein [Streptomyces noursei]|uniref:hypothetical protein n=1 Tax=Streptomyces noursei TaxID=1971 RepID=UPI00380E21D9
MNLMKETTMHTYLPPLAIGLVALVVVFYDHWPEAEPDRDWWPLILAVTFLVAAALLYFGGYPGWALLAALIAVFL